MVVDFYTAGCGVFLSGRTAVVARNRSVSIARLAEFVPGQVVAAERLSLRCLVIRLTPDTINFCILSICGLDKPGFAPIFFLGLQDEAR